MNLTCNIQGHDNTARHDAQTGHAHRLACGVAVRASDRHRGIRAGGVRSVARRLT